MDLMLEITRRCNMTCSHCLRGGAQRVDILDYVLSKTVYHWPFERFGIVIFTGGEPSLRPDRIWQFWNEMLQHKKYLRAWELTTNAKHITQDFLNVLERITDCVDDKGMCGIRISNDCFHKNELRKNDHYKLLDWGGNQQYSCAH